MTAKKSLDVLIRDVPREVVGKLDKLADRERRKRNHQILVILENAVKNIE